MSAGACLLLLPAGTYTVVLLPGLAGTSGFLFGAGLAVLGIFLVLQPRSHAFAGAAAMLLAITSLVTTNLGGFGLGLALGVLGGAWGLAWTPDVEGFGPPRSTSGGDDGGPPDTPNPADPPTRPISSSRHEPSIRR